MQTTVAIVGGGPAGLMAAEVLAQRGHRVDVFDAMPSVGRKFLLAGVGGMNITHSEAKSDFLGRYAEGGAFVSSWLSEWDADDLRAWASGLGIETFVGSSGRVFPKEMKAAPLLRAWLHRLRGLGVGIHVRHRWVGWQEGLLKFDSPQGECLIEAKATLLALGGASWPKLGSDGSWVKLLTEQRVAITPLAASNVGFQCEWSPFLAGRFAGQPLKNIAAQVQLPDGECSSPRRGEAMLTAFGIEGGLIYALSQPLRTSLQMNGIANLRVDLLPDYSVDKIQRLLSAGRGAKSHASFFASKLKLDAVRFALLRERLSAPQLDDVSLVTNTLKGFSVQLTGMQPITEAISTAGGVGASAVDDQLMLQQLPGVFCAGEMLDWDAPTGGYLLTACLSSGRYVAHEIDRWLANQ